MMTFPKFIISGKNLIMGRVKYHKQLAIDGLATKGGGWFKINVERKNVVLGGESHDFGKASFEDIAECVKSNNIFTNRLLTRRVEGYTYYYDNGSERILIPA